jgi:uncharacterized protein (TIGR02611 family)
MKVFFLKSLRHARKLIIAIIGFTVLLIGIAMIFLPGPAFIVIPTSLMILGTEFIWARKLLLNVKRRLKNQFETGDTKKRIGSRLMTDDRDSAG